MESSPSGIRKLGLCLVFFVVLFRCSSQRNEVPYQEKDSPNLIIILPGLSDNVGMQISQKFRVLKSSIKTPREIIYVGSLEKNLCLKLPSGTYKLEISMEGKTLKPFRGQETYELKDSTNLLLKLKKFIIVLHETEPTILKPKIGDSKINLMQSFLRLPVFFLYPIGFFPQYTSEVDFEFIHPEGNEKFSSIKELCQNSN